MVESEKDLGDGELRDFAKMVGGRTMRRHEKSGGRDAPAHVSGTLS